MGQWRRVERYIAGLPQGLASYPACKAKCSLVRAALGIHSVPRSLPAGLPPALAELLHAPPPATAWIPETHYNAACLAITDLHSLDHEGFAELWYDLMRALMSGPIYGRLFRLLSPSFIVRSAASRWGQFHRGWTVDAQVRRLGLEIGLRFPADLLDPYMIHGYRGVWQAMIDQSRTPSARARVIFFDEAHARYFLSGFTDDGTEET